MPQTGGGVLLESLVLLGVLVLLDALLADVLASAVVLSFVIGLT